MQWTLNLLKVVKLAGVGGTQRRQMTLTQQQTHVHIYRFAVNICLMLLHCFSFRLSNATVWAFKC